MVTTTLQPDYNKIRQSLSTLYIDKSSCFEIRLLNVTHKYLKNVTVSGYFTDVDRAVNELKTLINSAEYKYTGIYLTINPIDISLSARRFNRLSPVGKDETTKDKEITCRKFFYIDFDHEKASGISSSNEEKEAAKKKAFHVYDTLDKEGWPCPYFADSGNGYHLIYRIEEPAEDHGLIKGVLNGLNERFKTFEPKVKIDLSVFNPARITKLYGTPVCKGDNTLELGRVHRLSEIVDGPDTADPVKTELLKAAWLPEPELAREETVDTYTGPKAFESLEEWATRFKLELGDGQTDSSGWSKWNVECPFDSTHGHKGDTQVYEQGPKGKRGFKCQHNTCTGKKWADFREKIEATYNPLHPASKPVNQTDREVPSSSDPSIYKQYIVNIDESLTELVNEPPPIPTGIKGLDDSISGLPLVALP